MHRRTQTETYYPPRAGRLSKWLPRHSPIVGFFRAAWRKVAPIAYAAPLFLQQGRLLAVPGQWMRHTPAARWGALLQKAWLASLLVFGVWMGSVLGNLAYTAMVSLHCSSVISFVTRAYPQRTVLRQVLQGIGMFLLVGQVVYPSGLALLERFACMPARLDGKVVVINCLPWAQKPQVGDQVVYRSVPHAGGGYVALGGVTQGRILSGPGEVRFSEKTFETDSGTFPRLHGMPRQGNLKIRPGDWLIWPKANAFYTYAQQVERQIGLQAIGRPQAAEEVLSQYLIRISRVPEKQILGKPFQYWLWRRQIE
ncbi:MAG: hypothetical protein RLZZ399_1927 [Verrucomicrobiota bacterium]